MPSSSAFSEKGGTALAIQADVSNHDDIKRLFAETKAAYGKLDVLVNNAGIYEFAPLESITAEHFHKHFNLNVLGLLLTTQEAVKLIGSDGRLDHQHQLHRSVRCRSRPPLCTVRLRRRWTP